MIFGGIDLVGIYMLETDTVDRQSPTRILLVVDKILQCLVMTHSVNSY